MISHYEPRVNLIFCTFMLSGIQLRPKISCFLENWAGNFFTIAAFHSPDKFFERAANLEAYSVHPYRDLGLLRFLGVFKSQKSGLTLNSILSA